MAANSLMTICCGPAIAAMSHAHKKKILPKGNHPALGCIIHPENKTNWVIQKESCGPLVQNFLSKKLQKSKNIENIRKYAADKIKTNAINHKLKKQNMPKIKKFPNTNVVPSKQKTLSSLDHLMKFDSTQTGFHVYSTFACLQMN